jgi:hypothetical protein
MRHYTTLMTTGTIALLSLLAGPAFAESSTHAGLEAGCEYHIVCIINGQIVTGPAQAACNGGKVQTVRQCNRKSVKQH